MPATRRLLNVIVLTALSLSSAYAMEEMYFRSTWIGEGEPIALTQSGHVAFNARVWYTGRVQGSWGEPYYVPALWIDGETFYLQDDRWKSVMVCGMNNLDQLVGTIIDDEDVSWAAFWNGAEWQPLDGVPPQSNASEISDNGTVVGTYIGEDEALHPFMFSNHGFLDITPEFWASEYYSGYYLWVRVNANDTVYIFSQEEYSWASAVSTSAHGLESLDDAVTNLHITTFDDLSYVPAGYIENGSFTAIPVYLSGFDDVTFTGYAVDDGYYYSFGNDTWYWMRILGVSSGLTSTSYPRLLPAKINDVQQVLANSSYLFPNALRDSLFLIVPCGAPNDTTPPVFVTASATCATWNDPPLFSFEVSDSDPGIDWNTARVYVDGNFVPCGYSGNEILCAFDHALPWGEHYIDVSICDLDGNETTQWFVFFFGDEDEENAPIIDQTVPTGVIATATPEISARVRDSQSWVWWYGYSYYDWLALIDSEVVAVRLDTTYGSEGRVYFELDEPLSEGEHTVYLQVRDNEFNSADVYWSFTVDTAHVSVSSTAPIGYVSTSAVTVSATVELSGGVAWDDIDVYVDYVQVSYWHDGGGHVTCSATGLAEGIHYATVAGVTWSFFVDTTPPEIADLMPDPSYCVTTSNVFISASLLDYGSSISSSSLRVFLDEVERNDVVNDFWNFYFFAEDLTDDEHTVRVYVKDDAGNTIPTLAGTWTFTIDTTTSITLTDLLPEPESSTTNPWPEISATFDNVPNPNDILGSRTTVFLDGTMIRTEGDETAFVAIPRGHFYENSDHYVSVLYYNGPSQSANVYYASWKFTIACAGRLLVTISASAEIPVIYSARATLDNEDVTDLCTFEWFGFGIGGSGSTFTTPEDVVDGKYNIEVKAWLEDYAGYATILIDDPTPVPPTNPREIPKDWYDDGQDGPRPPTPRPGLYKSGEGGYTITTEPAELKLTKFVKKEKAMKIHLTIAPGGAAADGTQVRIASPFVDTNSPTFENGNATLHAAGLEPGKGFMRIYIKLKESTTEIYKDVKVDVSDPTVFIENRTMDVSLNNAPNAVRIKDRQGKHLQELDIVRVQKVDGEMITKAAMDAPAINSPMNFEASTGDHIGKGWVTFQIIKFLYNRNAKGDFRDFIEVNY